MQRLDKSILEGLGLSRPRVLPYAPADQDIMFLNGFAFHHRNYYYAMEGKFPLKHAQLLWDGGHSQLLAIREDGHGNGGEPLQFATSDAYEAQVWAMGQEWMSKRGWADREAVGSLDAKAIELKRLLLQDAPETFFLEQYHIDTSDGLIFMIKYIQSENIRTEWNLP
jgi:hypothetical protein